MIFFDVLNQRMRMIRKEKDKNQLTKNMLSLFDIRTVG